MDRRTRTSFVTPREGVLNTARSEESSNFVTPRELPDAPHTALAVEDTAAAGAAIGLVSAKIPAPPPAPAPSASAAGRERDAAQQRAEELFKHARHGHVAELEAMLEGGVPVDARDQFGNTLLIVACQNGNKRVAKIALRNGANINAQNLKGNTAAHYCFGFDYRALGEYLVSKGANEALRNNFGLTCRQGLNKPDAGSGGASPA